MIRPLHDYLLVQRNEAMNITKGGILLPDVAQEKPQEGLVLAAGQGCNWETYPVECCRWR